MTDGAIFIVILLAVAVYFLPTIIAASRDKAYGQGGIFALNLLLGWTLVGWVGAFIWACTGITKRDKFMEALRHQELLTALKGGRDAQR